MPSHTPRTLSIMLRRSRTMSVTVMLLFIPLLQSLGARSSLAGSHIRASEPALRVSIADGVAQSASFRRLVTRLETSDVIVYVQTDCTMSALVGRLTFMSKAGQRRYVLVRIACGLGQWLEIATLGHELRHAVEIADDASVVDQGSLAEMYKRSGFASSLFKTGAGYDSQVAIETGRRVWDELSSGAE